MRTIESTTFEDMRDLFLKFANEGTASVGLQRSDNVRLLENFRREWSASRRDSFYGGTIADMVGWLNHGYVIPGLTFEPELAPVRKRRKVNFNDMEGDYQHDLFISGFDFPYMEGTPRESTPTMDFEIDVCFPGGTSGIEVAKYTQWNLKALIALQTAGIGCDVWISNRVTSCFKGKGNRPFGDCEFRIKVVNSGEALDLTDWSAIFSPSGYRILIWFTKIVLSDRRGYGVPDGLGTPVMADSYQVKFREQDRVIHSRATRYGRFSEDKMDSDFRLCLELARN